MSQLGSDVAIGVSTLKLYIHCCILHDSEIGVTTLGKFRGSFIAVVTLVICYRNFEYSC